MLDSESKYKYKQGHLGQFSNLCLHQQLSTFKEIWMETIFSSILKTTNATKLTKAILESCYRILQVTCKLKAVNLSLYLSIY